MKLAIGQRIIGFCYHASRLSNFQTFVRSVFPSEWAEWDEHRRHSSTIESWVFSHATQARLKESPFSAPCRSSRSRYPVFFATFGRQTVHGHAHSPTKLCVLGKVRGDIGADVGCHNRQVRSARMFGVHMLEHVPFPSCYSIIGQPYDCYSRLSSSLLF